MQLINQSKGIILAQDAILADTPLPRMKGLLGRKEFKPAEALILKPCNSIHTFFMQFPIDVLFLDKDNRVIKTISSLKPFRLTPVYFQATSAIELPSGTIHSTLTAEGDTLILE